MAGSGTMRERKRGVWTLRAEIPARGATRKWRSETFKGTKAGARARLAELVKEVKDEFPANPKQGEWTFDALFEAWINGLSLTTQNPRAASTMYQERKRYERHVKPEFGNRLVESVQKVELKAFFQGLRKERMVPGESEKRKEIGATSVARIHELMSAMCAWGFDGDLLNSNPMLTVRRPRIPAPVPAPPDYAPLDSLLQRLWRNDRTLWVAVRIAATVGARRSELVALRWFDVVFEGRGAPAIQIERGIVKVPGRGAVETNTKTGVDGSGLISIDDELCEVLQEAWVEFLKKNGGVPKDGYLFSQDEDGARPWHPDTLSSRLRKQVRLHGKPQKRAQITFKSLRAYVASELEALGNDMATAQAVLRHKSPMTTQRHYVAAQTRKRRQATVGVGEQFTKRGYTKPS